MEFDFESIVLRRADPDDLDDIVNLVEIGEDDIYGRVYSYPNVLKLIETAYLAITVIDRDGKVVGFAAFEDFPQVSIRDRICLTADGISGTCTTCIRCLMTHVCSCCLVDRTRHLARYERRFTL